MIAQYSFGGGDRQITQLVEMYDNLGPSNDHDDQGSLHDPDPDPDPDPSLGPSDNLGPSHDTGLLHNRDPGPSHIQNLDKAKLLAKLVKQLSRGYHLDYDFHITLKSAEHLFLGRRQGIG